VIPMAGQWGGKPARDAGGQDQDMSLSAVKDSSAEQPSVWRQCICCIMPEGTVPKNMGIPKELVDQKPLHKKTWKNRETTRITSSPASRERGVPFPSRTRRPPWLLLL
jgi:hypothetical protein